MNDWDDMSEPELVEYTRSESLERRGKALEVLGHRNAARGNLRLARAYMEQSVQVNDEANNLEWATTSRQLLGRILNDLGEHELAIDHLTEAACGFQSLLWDRVLAETLGHRAMANKQISRFDCARADFDSAADLFAEGHHTDQLMSLLLDYAEMESRFGLWEKVQTILQRAAQVAETSVEFDTRLTIHLGLIEAATKLREPADDHVEKARALSKLTSKDWHPTIVESWAARNLLARNELDRAQLVIDRMDATLPPSDGKRLRVAVLRSLLADELSGGDTIGDLEALKTAFLLGTSYEDPDWLPLAATLLSYHYGRHGDFPTALDYIRKTLDQFHETFPPEVIFELALQETELLAAIGEWDAVAERLASTEVPPTVNYVVYLSRLLKVTINRNISIGAPVGEVIHRLHIATANAWYLHPTLSTDEESADSIGQENQQVATVPGWLRSWAFQRAAHYPEFEAQKQDLLTRVAIIRSGLDELPDPEPLNQAGYHVDHTLYAPYVGDVPPAYTSADFDEMEAQ